MHATDSASDMRDHLGIFFTRLARRVIDVREVTPVTGGSIQATYAVTLGTGDKVFVKAGPPDDMERLRAEARGLNALAETKTVRVPEVLLSGGEGQHYYLVLEHVDLRPGTEPGFERMGRELAALHRATAPAFGFERDNFIGATPQANVQADDWPEFFRTRRLLPQLQRAARGACAGQWVDEALRLAESAALFFPGYTPVPSLLHGDLWGGNAGFVDGGTPILYDPAVYYGDRETDIAMTELFGGFAPGFHAAYREAWPLDPGYATRRDLYNLYHVINHVNLFGAGHVARAHDLTARLLALIK